MPTQIGRARTILEKRVERLMEDGPFLHADTIGDIRDALKLMKRKTNKVPAKRTSAKITDEIIHGVLRVYEAHPSLSCKEIGDVFNINSGRVSEIINGVRTPESPDLPGDGMSEIIREAMLRAREKANRKEM